MTLCCRAPASQTSSGTAPDAREIASLDDDLTLQQHDSQGAKMWSLPVPGAAVALTLFHHKGTVGLSFGGSSCDQTIARLAGRAVSIGELAIGRPRRDSNRKNPRSRRYGTPRLHELPQDPKRLRRAG